MFFSLVSDNSVTEAAFKDIKMWLSFLARRFQDVHSQRRAVLKAECAKIGLAIGVGPDYSSSSFSSVGSHSEFDEDEDEARDEDADIDSLFSSIGGGGISRFSEWDRSLRAFLNRLADSAYVSFFVRQL